MLFAYLLRGNSLERSVVEESGAIPDGVVWFDLVSPTLAEDKMLEREPDWAEFINTSFLPA